MLRITNFVRNYEKMKPQILKRKDLIYPELSYQIVGVLFDVWNEVGFGHKEKFYQNAVSIGLKNIKLNFGEQVPMKVYYKNKKIGLYYFDFFIENKIILEIKVRNYFSKKDIEQAYSYLKSNNLKLCIIAHFTRTGVKYKRILNLY